MTIKKLFSIGLLVFVALALQSQQPDKPKPFPTDTLPDSIAKEKPAKVDSTEILTKKLDIEIKKTAETSERINKKVARIPPLIDKALITIRRGKVADIQVKPLDPIQATAALPEVKVDTTIKKKPRRRFLRFLKSND